MKNIDASIITIGDELLIGQTIDTNSAFIAQELNKIGVWVKRRTAIGDVKEEILSTLALQLKDSDIVIITGGLGPTADDITKPALCEFFQSDIVVNEQALQNVKDIFIKLNRPLIERNLRQADVPDNCIVLQNSRGTAPGMWFSWPMPQLHSQPAIPPTGENQKYVVSLPGVPHEMKGMIMSSVIPMIKERFQLPAVIHRTLLTAGIGESMLAEAIGEFETGLPSHIKLAYLPSYGLVRLRLTGRGENLVQVEKEVQELFESLKLRVNQWMVAETDVPLQEALNSLLRTKGKTIATAESCTGGYIAHLITSVAGSSDVFKGSVVGYANSAKEKLLAVDAAILAIHGAVSEETVTQMVKGALSAFECDYAIATSGIMGPSGSTETKPVGTVWIAVGDRHGIKTSLQYFRFDRARNIELTAHTALTMLYRFIKRDE